jgi:hypothetical protein
LQDRICPDFQFYSNFFKTINRRFNKLHSNPNEKEEILQVRKDYNGNVCKLPSEFSAVRDQKKRVKIFFFISLAQLLVDDKIKSVPCFTQIDSQIEQYQVELAEKQKLFKSLEKNFKDVKAKAENAIANSKLKLDERKWQLKDMENLLSECEQTRLSKQEERQKEEAKYQELTREVEDQVKIEYAKYQKIMAEIDQQDKASKVFNKCLVF